MLGTPAELDTQPTAAKTADENNISGFPSKAVIIRPAKNWMWRYRGNLDQFTRQMAVLTVEYQDRYDQHVGSNAKLEIG